MTDYFKLHILHFLIAFFFFPRFSYAQVISFGDTITTYNKARIKINKMGMRVLGAWGIANIAEGTVGYFTAKQDEWKYFHGMPLLFRFF